MYVYMIVQYGYTFCTYIIYIIHTVQDCMYRTACTGLHVHDYMYRIELLFIGGRIMHAS